MSFVSLRRVCLRRTLGNVAPQVLAYERHFRLFPCAWFQPCRENVTVFLGSKDDGNVIGRVTQSCCGGCFEPKLNILDKEWKRQLVMKGPCIVTDCCGAKFDVHSETGDNIKVGFSRLSRVVADLIGCHPHAANFVACDLVLPCARLVRR